MNSRTKFICLTANQIVHFPQKRKQKQRGFVDHTSIYKIANWHLFFNFFAWGKLGLWYYMSPPKRDVNPKFRWRYRIFKLAEILPWEFQMTQKSRDSITIFFFLKTVQNFQFRADKRGTEPPTQVYINDQAYITVWTTTHNRTVSNYY